MIPGACKRLVVDREWEKEWVKERGRGGRGGENPTGQRERERGGKRKMRKEGIMEVEKKNTKKWNSKVKIGSLV